MNKKTTSTGTPQDAHDEISPEPTSPDAQVTRLLNAFRDGVLEEDGLLQIADLGWTIPEGRSTPADPAWDIIEGRPTCRRDLLLTLLTAVAAHCRRNEAS